jgi:hypothetical protein
MMMILFSLCMKRMRRRKMRTICRISFLNRNQIRIINSLEFLVLKKMILKKLKYKKTIKTVLNRL